MTTNVHIKFKTGDEAFVGNLQLIKMQLPNADKEVKTFEDFTLSTCEKIDFIGANDSLHTNFTDILFVKLIKNR